MSSDFSLRYAIKEDLPFIVDIYNSTIPSRMVTADTEVVSIESKEPWFNEHNAIDRPLWILLYEGQPCGWLSIQSFYGRPAYKATTEISIYMHEQYRGRGLGKVFMNLAFQKCSEIGIKTLLGFIFGHNGPSMSLFKALGFEQWAFLPSIAELDGVERDLVIMGKKLDDA